MKYVIWGAGLRGGRLFRHLKNDDVIAFVDKSVEKVGSHIYGKEIISLDEYLRDKRYEKTMLVIAHSFEQGAVDELQRLGVRRYMKLSDCPGEFQEENTRPYISSYVKANIDRNKSYGILGNTVYSLEVYSWLAEIGNQPPYLIIDKSVSEEVIQLIEWYGYNIIEESGIYNRNIHTILDCRYAESTDDTCFFAGFHVKNIYDCSDVIKEYYNPQIERLKDTHKDKTCFIVATGPSLNIGDLDILEKNKSLSFGVNKIGYAYDRTKWRPTFFVGEDKALLESEYFSNIRPEKQSEYAFLADTSENFWQEEHNVNVLKYHLCDEWAFGRYPKFSEDLSRKSYVGGTIVYTCIQLAVYLGFRKIYLLGVDFTGAGEHGSKYNHFYSEKELTSVSYTDQVKFAYEKANSYAEQHGIKIYNATRGGRLEIFERVNFDELF